MFEDKHNEFKSEFSDEIKKTVVAFANTDGGTLYINTPQTAAPHRAAARLFTASIKRILARLSDVTYICTSLYISFGQLNNGVFFIYYFRYNTSDDLSAPTNDQKCASLTKNELT